MNVLSIVEQIEELLANASGVPFSSKKMVDGEALQALLEELKANLPEEIRQCEIIIQQKHNILLDAEHEADDMVKAAEERAKLMVEDHEITQKAYQYSRELVADAQRTAKDVRIGARVYADELMADVEKYVGDTLRLVKKNRLELKSGRDERSADPAD